MIASQRRLMFAGLLLFLISLTMNIPADRVLYLVREKLPQAISWQKVSGSVFHPTFNNLFVRTDRGRGLLLESAELKIAILPLLIGRLKMQFELKPKDGELSGVLILKSHDWQLPEIEGNVSVVTLAEFLPELKLAGPGGRVQFSGDALAGEEGSLNVTGNMKATVEKLQLDMLNIQRPLGDYSIQLRTGDDSIIQGKIETVSTDAQLNIQGDLSMAPDSRVVQFKGQAWVAANASASVQSLLSLLGPIEQGRARIDWQAGF